MDDLINAKYSKTILQNSTEITNSVFPNQKRWVINVNYKEDLTQTPFIKKTVSSYSAPIITFEDKSTAPLNETLPIINKETIDEDELLNIKVISNVDIINNLNNRFKNKKTFTNIGETLIIIHPSIIKFNEYKIEVIEALLNLKNEEEYIPHLYTNVLRALTALMVSQSKNQLIIFHGEDNQGKTEAFDQAIKFITHFGSNKKDANLKDELLITQIRNINKILEAFGNAKTKHNDNSLRFGKYIKLFFDINRNTIKGAFISLLPLERSRIINNYNNLERNYHIFYYLINGCDYEYLKKLGLKNDSSAYSYLKQNNNVMSLNVNDYKEKYNEVMFCLKSLEFTSEDIEGIAKVLSVILLLGNIQIDLNNSICILKQEETFKKISNLLGVNQFYFQMVLTRKPPLFGSKQYGELYKETEIKNNIDSFAQQLYCKVFEWIVRKINYNLQDTSLLFDHFIGLIDFYAFQNNNTNNSQFNSIDQLCINYINEQIHQLYLKNCFENNKLEYIKEGLDDHIASLNVSYQNNIEIIKRLKMFFNQTVMAKRNDQIYSIAESFKNDIIQTNELYPNTFNINHTHDNIEYSTDCYIYNNNRDVSPGLIDCILASSDHIIQFIYTNSLSDKENIEAKDILLKERLKPDPKKKMRKEMISRCILQFKELKREIKNSNQHYILFIKPNQASREKSEINIWPNYVYKQIQYFSIPSLISIKNNSYSVYYSYAQFYQNNHLVGDSDYTSDTITNYAKAVKFIIEKVMGENCNYADCFFGKSKLFLKRTFYMRFLVKKNDIVMKKQLNCSIIQRGIYYIRKRIRLNEVDLCVQYLQDQLIACNIKQKFKKKISNIPLIQALYKRYILHNEYNWFRLHYSNIQNGLKILFAKQEINVISQKSNLINIRLNVYIQRLKENNKKMTQKTVYEVIEKSIELIEKNEYCLIYYLIKPFIHMHFIQNRYYKVIKIAKERINIDKQLLVISLFQERNSLFQIKKHKASALKIALFFQIMQYKSYYSVLRYNLLIIQAYLKRKDKDNSLKKINNAFFQFENYLTKINKEKAYKILFPNRTFSDLITYEQYNNCDSLFKDNHDVVDFNEFTEKQLKCVSCLPNTHKKKEKFIISPSIQKISYYEINTKPKIKLFSAILDYDIVSDTNEAYINWAKEYSYYNQLNLKCNTPLTIIQTGNTHTLALNSKGKVFSWGWNNYGQCGKMNQDPIKLSKQIITYSEIGMINFLSVPYYQSFGANVAKSIIGRCNQVIVGEEYSILLSTNGNVYSVGNNTKGQLGLGNMKSINNAPIQINKINNEIRVIKKIYSANSFNVLFTNDNKLFTWYTSKNKIGIKPMQVFLDNKIIIKQIACGKNFMIVLSKNGFVYGSGSNTHGELDFKDNSSHIIFKEINNINSFNENIIQIKCGYKHVLALSFNGKIYSWGNNSYGQLGHADKKDNGVTIIKLSFQQKVIQIACGFRCSLFLTETRDVYFTGRLSNENFSLTPIMFDMKVKSNEYCCKYYAPVRILASWNQSFSIFYASMADLSNVINNIKDNVIEDIIKSLASQWLDETVTVPHLSQYFEMFE